MYRLLALHIVFLLRISVECVGTVDFVVCSVGRVEISLMLLVRSPASIDGLLAMYADVSFSLPIDQNFVVFS